MEGRRGTLVPFGVRVTPAPTGLGLLLSSFSRSAEAAREEHRLWRSASARRRGRRYIGGGKEIGRRVVSTVKTRILALIVLCGCPVTPPVTDEGPATGGPILSCPGETQCPCEAACPEGMTCGPTNACTKPCKEHADCSSGVSGESCLGGLCGVPCNPKIPNGGCVPSGMPGSVCQQIPGTTTYACGYPPS